MNRFQDELLWASFWLFEATGDENYLEYTSVKAQELGGTGWAMTQFGWDVKYSGLQVLASKVIPLCFITVIFFAG